jgi:hypothetical protein
MYKTNEKIEKKVRLQAITHIAHCKYHLFSPYGPKYLSRCQIFEQIFEILAFGSCSIKSVDDMRRIRRLNVIVVIGPIYRAGSVVSLSRSSCKAPRKYTMEAWEQS